MKNVTKNLEKFVKRGRAAQAAVDKLTASWTADNWTSNQKLNEAALPELYLAALAAHHLCLSLLACPGATHELIQEVADALNTALARARGENS